MIWKRWMAFGHGRHNQILSEWSRKSVNNCPSIWLIYIKITKQYVRLRVSYCKEHFISLKLLLHINLQCHCQTLRLKIDEVEAG